MGLEAGTYISSLNASNPTSSDAKTQGDDHLRLIKSTILSTFPNITGAVTPTHTELNYVDGVTSAIQTQLDAKAALAGPTFSGTPTFGGSGAGSLTSSGWVKSVYLPSGNALYIDVKNSAATGRYAFFGGTSTDNNWYFGRSTLADGTTAPTYAMWITNTGIVKIGSSQPSFYAYRSTDQTSGTTVIFDAEGHDQGSNYDNSTGTFTAPIAGIYLFTTNVTFKAANQTYSPTLVLFKNGTTNVATGYNTTIPTNEYRYFSLSVTVQLNVNDTMRVDLTPALATPNGGQIPSTYLNTFSGHLLG